MAPPAPDADGDLASALGVLASPTRIRLLRALRAPRTLREIEVSSPDEPDRPLARQSVKQHLDLLLGAGIVLAREAERPYGTTSEYLLNHQTIFALAEEMRSLARLRPLVEPESVTVRSDSKPAFAPSRPCLVVVKGLEEGVAFPLAPGRAEWTIGRRRGAEVSLDFDPYVSSENSRIVARGGRHVLEDLPENRNGTWLNFASLQKGAAKALSHGDIVGVGRTLLVYWS